MCHDFIPKPGDLMWTPADWAWIGGLINALFAFWYHGVPLVGHALAAGLAALYVFMRGELVDAHLFLMRP